MFLYWCIVLFVQRNTGGTAFNGNQLPSILGSDHYIQWVKETFYKDKEDKEVTASRMLAPDAKKIKDEVCKYYGIQRDTLNTSRRGVSNEARNVAIYLTRLLRKDTLDVICRDYSMNRYSSASSAIERVKMQMRQDKKFKMRADKIKNQIISTKG